MYTISEYKNNLTQEHLAKLRQLFASLDKGDIEQIEELLVDILTWLINRNSEDTIVNSGDFSLIMLLMNDFDDEYNEWSFKNGKLIKPLPKRGGNKLLFKKIPNSKNLEILMEEVFLYLEHDVYKPRAILLKAIKEYKNTKTINALYE